MWSGEPYAARGRLRWSRQRDPAVVRRMCTVYLTTTMLEDLQRGTRVAVPIRAGKEVVYDRAEP